MICEFLVGTGKVELGHMAGDAIPGGHFTNMPSELGRVAGYAFCIVGPGGGCKAVVRVVTSGAADTLVSGVVALAAGETVWLKTNVLNATGPVCGDVTPGAMTLATEIGNLLSSELCELLQWLVRWTDMRLSRAVAAFTLNAGNHGGGCVGCMTAEALRSFFGRCEPACGFGQVRWFDRLIAYCDVEALKGAVVADQTFIPAAIFSVEIGLPGGTLAEGPFQRDAESLLAIGDCVD